MTTRHDIASRHIKHPFSIVEDETGNWDIECEFTVDINKDLIDFEYQQACKTEQTKEETKQRILEIATLEDQTNAQSTVLSIITEPNWEENQEYVATINHLKKQLDMIKHILVKGQMLKQRIAQAQALSQLEAIEPKSDVNWE